MGRLTLASAVLLIASAGAAQNQEHFALAGGKYLLIYRNTPVNVRNSSIERVFILVHGLQRDGHVYYKSAYDATSDAGRLNSTLVIAPQFHACTDKPDAGEAFFACRGWSDGSTTPEFPLSSFTAMDQLLEGVADRSRFPRLKEIVLAGHSAGGQFVQRYAAANRIDGKLAVPIRYIVANPSTYLYLDSWRPVATRCAEFDDYKFGLAKLDGYAAGTGADAIRAQYPRRNVTYVLGELDTTDEHNMDKTCPATAQGPNRFARGMAYSTRIRDSWHARHGVVKVPGCGHSAECMYRSPNVRKVVFPD
jgi:pimeloyl-ACP methyl ester carboxylesterase